MKMSSSDLIQIISEDNSVYAIFDDNKSCEIKSKNIILHSPSEHIIAFNEDEVLKAITKIDELKNNGLYLGGYISYEAGYSFVDKRISTSKKGSSQPLVNFYAFTEMVKLSKSNLNRLLIDSLKKDNQRLSIHNLTLNESKDKYNNSINKIIEYITSGDTYQVNYTLKYKFDLEGSPLALYASLRNRQSVNYGAFLNFKKEKILSISPELFIEKYAKSIKSKPMKGTARRGDSVEEDNRIIHFMRNDPKTISENIIIVDLIRNDLGRICDSGSIKVENVFEIQSFETVHQMVSTVRGKIDENISFLNVMKGIFPCGSITGAPKLRTMEIINELESEDRGVYTGAIGFIIPNNNFCFNVPIRTIRTLNGKCEMGIGSGITSDSHAEKEFDECLLKAKFLTERNDKFYLI